MVAISHKFSTIHLISNEFSAGGGIFLKFVIFTGATSSTKMEIRLRSISNEGHLHEKIRLLAVFCFQLQGFR